MNALVLSGGGGKGAYQIGVWKALRKLHYKIDIVTGTSVGALNAVLVTQKSYFLAPRIWNKIDFKEVFQDDTKSVQTMKETISMYGKNIIKNKGMSTDNLEKKLEEAINKRKFYKSKIKFGLVTFNITNLKPKLLTKDKIPKDKLKDYLMASATCFPAFKMKNIDGNNYIDGGYYDVLPINLAIDMGATNIVAVDLKSVGIRRKVKNKDIKITYIYPRNHIGHSLIFNKDINKKNIHYGYNDTMKTFNKLVGNKYTFKKNTLKKINTKFKEIININVTYFLKNKISNKNIDILKIIESLGKTFNIADDKIYSIRKFNQLLKKEVKNIKISKVYHSKKELIEYLYLNMCENKVSIIKRNYLLHQKEVIQAIYLYTIIKGVHNEV